MGAHRELLRNILSYGHVRRNTHTYTHIQIHDEPRESYVVPQHTKGSNTAGCRWRTRVVATPLGKSNVAKYILVHVGLARDKTFGSKIRKDEGIVARVMRETQRVWIVAESGRAIYSYKV